MTLTTIVLDNANLRAEFNPTNGALTRLLNKASGWEMQRRPELGLSFLLEVPVPGGAINRIHGECQAVASVTVADDGASVTFTWERVTSTHGGEMAIGFTGTATLTDTGLSFQGQVRNQSAQTVNVVAYPCVGDLTPSSTETTLDHQIFFGNSHFSSNRLYPTMGQGMGYWGVNHLAHSWATTVQAPFILIAEPQQGLFVCTDAPEPQMMAKWYFEEMPGNLDSYTCLLPDTDTFNGTPVALQFMVHHFAYVHPGQTGDLTPVVMQPYQGDWHAGIDRFRAWHASWFREPKIPAWVKDVHAWLQIQICGAEDTVNFTYTDLPAIAADCKAHGIDVIQLTGWAWGGQDRGNPSHDTEPMLGTFAELAQAIQECQAMGVKIILFTKWTWYDESQERYQTEGVQHVARDPYGNPYPAGGYQYGSWTQLAGLNTRRLIPTCTASAAWRQVALDEFKKVVATGAAGMLFDESCHHGSAYCCFSTEHGHASPAFLYGFDNVMMREFKQYSEQINPDFLYGGEDCLPYQMLEYHLPYTRFWNGCIPARRYALPFQPIMMAVTGFDDRNQLNKCLQYRYIISYEPYQFKGRPSDAPLTMTYGRKVDDLRRRYREYVWDGTFRHTVGASVTTDGKPYEDYVVYERTDGKRALLIANIDAKATITATFALDGGLRGTPVVVDPEHPEPRSVGNTVQIPPRSIAVMLEQ